VSSITTSPPWARTASRYAGTLLEAYHIAVAVNLGIAAAGLLVALTGVARARGSRLATATAD